MAKEKKRPKVKRKQHNLREIDSRRRRNPKLEVHHPIMPQEPEDDDRFYVIEKLLEKRVNEKGQEEFLVKWQNYSDDWNSWEPRNELEKNSMDMIKEFERNLDPNSDSLELHCICQRPYRFDQGGMIQCFYCLKWYHFTCLSMNMEEANLYARYFCSSCKSINPRLKSIFKEDKLTTFYGKSLSQQIKEEKILEL